MRKVGKRSVYPEATFDGLPDELADFLSKDTYSLLVKGDSGTGKTILALTILKRLSPIENLLYLSTRTSPLQLVENYPWVEDVFGPGEGGGETPDKEEGWETLVDARLDEPNVVFERITNVLMDRQAPTVVIDSWESLSDAVGSEALRTNIRVLQTWRERAGARFIFIGEDPQNTAIDYLVEGAVTLKDRIEKGRRLREIYLSKLHGVQISRPSYYFTLRGGIFTSFPSYDVEEYAFRSPMPVRFDRPFRRTRGRFPTGYSLLDSHMGGGYPSNSVGLVELDKRVDPKVGLVFVSRTFQDWLTAGDRVVLEKPDGVESRYLKQYVKSFGGDNVERLEVVDDFGGRVRRPDGGRKKSGAKERRKTLGVFTGRGAVRALASPGRPELPELDLALVVAREDEVPRELRDKVSTHVKLTEIDGTLFLECESPWTSRCGVIPGMTGGNPMISIEPVV